jgi:hypothetical protein
LTKGPTVNFQVVIIQDHRGDGHEIAVGGMASYEAAQAKAVDYARNRMGLNVEGAMEGEIVETISGGMIAI